MNTSSWDGKVLSLQCKARGLPSPQITWYKPSGQPITAGVSPISGGQLQLKTTQDSGDYGQYMCPASDLLWSVERLIDLAAISIRGTNLIPFLTSAKYKFCSGLNYFDLIRLALDLIGYTTPYPSTVLGGRALAGVILACVVIVAIVLV
ncbi:predicted protein [Nematostella vectensis]|uniref:Ig-like domain-containing protein n=1 Tax=Nematostella vectensis TaxID=45351 RepID=A7SWH8_NEMVE|nr:predicted protein [Nematostella vectensis]|eukprot:XP_001624030.1 predicted protein [Nematostella vectensis]